jgi:hypothetical protein
MSISGRVLDPSGSLILSESLVIFTMQEGIPESLKSNTFDNYNENGEFEIAGIQPGYWKIVVTCGGSQPAIFKLELSPDHPHSEIGVIILKIGRITEGDWFGPQRRTRKP